MRFTTVMLAGLTMASIAEPAFAQARARSGSTTIYRSSRDDDRAALGVNTSASGRRDTLGLLIQSVVPDSPAEKAGLEEGNRIVSINGVSLQLSRADAGENDMDGVMTRRLVRELRKITPGTEADLKIYSNGQTKTVKVKTIDTEELSEIEHRASRRMNQDDEDRAVVGLNFGGGNSKRDTLGIFIASITEDGPAAKAGLEEGNRIAAINGQDLRVSREDAGDGHMAGAKANRFRRIMRTLKPGDVVDLRIYANGQFRNVKVTTIAADELYKESGNFRMFNGEGGTFYMPRISAPVIPRAPRPPMPPGRSRMTIDLDDDADYHFELNDEMRVAVESAVEAARGAVEGLQPTLERLQPTLERAAIQAERAVLDATRGLRGSRTRSPRSAAVGEDDRCRASSTQSASQWREIATNPGSSRSFNDSGFGATYTLKIPGLCVTKVNADLAAYFGEGAERGLLVLMADTPFDDLRAGDILLSVNGKQVRTGDNGRLNFNAESENRIEFLRKGARMTATVQVEK